MSDIFCLFLGLNNIEPPSNLATKDEKIKIEKALAYERYAARYWRIMQKRHPPFEAQYLTPVKDNE